MIFLEQKVKRAEEILKSENESKIFFIDQEAKINQELNFNNYFI